MSPRQIPCHLHPNTNNNEDVVFVNGLRYEDRMIDMLFVDAAVDMYFRIK